MTKLYANEQFPKDLQLAHIIHTSLRNIPKIEKQLIRITKPQQA